MSYCMIYMKNEMIFKYKLQKKSPIEKIRDQLFYKWWAYFAAILNSIVLVLEAVVFEVTTTERL